MRVSAALAEARRRLAAAGIETPGLDVRVLASDVFGLDAGELISAGEDEVGGAALAAFRAVIERRAAGEPVGRIRGRREFYGLDIALSAATLEPRPDTETLVEVALDAVHSGRVPGAAPDGVGLLFADIGTGSGAIAVAMAVALPGARAIATDISTEALAIARSNAAAHGVADRLDFRAGDYLAPLIEPCGLIVSNPPYVESAAIRGLAPDVRDHDPRRALDGGPDGLAAYRAIAAGAGTALVAGGLLAVEIGATQADAVLQLFSAAGLANRAVHTDLGGRQRVVTAHSPVVQGTFIPGP